MFIIIAGIWTICLLFSAESQAGESLAEVKIPLEITPETHSGAYYAYNLHQTVILFKYRQRNILVTVSKQVDVSTVG